MKIYTRKGDGGETSLFGGQRIAKDALRIEAYGSVDELNSLLGVVRAMKPAGEIDALVRQLQEELFVLGADLATPSNAQSKNVPRIEQRHIDFLERQIDRMDAQLTPLTTFILPGGNPIGAQLHLARTVCRRAERLTVRLSKEEAVNALTIVYLNRLSDLLFVLARYANKIDGVNETPWSPSR
jgi:cob(I)alamin adenosyltransferase